MAQDNTVVFTDQFYHVAHGPQIVSTGQVKPVHDSSGRDGRADSCRFPQSFAQFLQIDWVLTGFRPLLVVFIPSREFLVCGPAVLNRVSLQLDHLFELDNLPDQ